MQQYSDLQPLATAFLDYPPTLHIVQMHSRAGIAHVLLEPAVQKRQHYCHHLKRTNSVSPLHASTTALHHVCKHFRNKSPPSMLSCSSVVAMRQLCLCEPLLIGVEKTTKLSDAHINMGAIEIAAAVSEPVLYTSREACIHSSRSSAAWHVSNQHLMVHGYFVQCRKVGHNGGCMRGYLVVVVVAVVTAWENVTSHITHDNNTKCNLIP